MTHPDASDFVLQTRRLLLREFDAADVAFIVELLNDPGWLLKMAWRPERTTSPCTTTAQSTC